MNVYPRMSKKSIYRKILRAGNNIVISLPKEMLEYLHLQPGAEVVVELDRKHHRIVIRPVQAMLSQGGVDEALARQVDAFIEQYRPTLEALAKK